MRLEEKIHQKVEKEIGDLISDEDLKEIIEQGIEKALFQERTEKGNYSTKKKPSIVDEVVDKHLKSRVSSAVETWLHENPEQIEKAVNDAISNGIGTAVLHSLDNRFASIFNQGIEQMQNQGILPQNF